MAPRNPFRWQTPIRTNNTSSLLGYLFPQTHRRLRTRLLDFRHDTLPIYRHRTQSYIWRLLVQRQKKKQERRARGKGWLPYLRRRRASITKFLGGENVAKGKMSNPDPSGSVTGFGNFWGEGKERGTRRKKVYGYLKAANEIRQSYQAQWSQRTVDDDDNSMPGAFPDAEAVRRGDEELVLFPSYGRRHVKQNSAEKGVPGAREDPTIHSSGDADYWKREWERFEDDNAIVDVDVRGWVYTPQRGAMSRKNRLMLAVARRLSGIPAPAATPGHSRASSRHSVNRERLDENSTKQEEEMASKEAQKIIQHGESEASAAQSGGYSEEPSRETRDDSPFSSRSVSPDLANKSRSIRRTPTNSTVNSDSEGEASFAKRRSWVPPERMSREELHTANEFLMARLKPFMTVPLTGLPISVFFFNENQSQSRTVHTNDSGHFNVRASLNFVPTHVRVLVSDNLSATEEVRITEPAGVSLISDIDDTIKHSAISSGAKEIFRNTFIRDLADLTVDGVKEWYSRLYNMGVKLHYVSNSPWQLYPVLRNYFGLAGLPPGSIHLKAYTGMLQGIFEPAAERKRGSLERIIRDFPERKFILVGDSGEADLEVYTDTVLENPGRVLAVFIRDVTTPAYKPLTDARLERSPERGPTKRGSDASSVKSLKSDVLDDRPALPIRPTKSATEPQPASTPTGTLISFDDEEPDQTVAPKFTNAADLAELSQSTKRQPPLRPSKPQNLRGSPSPSNRPSVTMQELPKDPASNDKKMPPPPPKPRRQKTTQSASEWARQATNGKSAYSTSARAARDGNGNTPAEGLGFAVSAGKQINLPSPRGRLPRVKSSSDTTADAAPPGNPAARPNPRRGLSGYSSAAAQYASNRLSLSSKDPPSPGLGPQQPYNKKEEMWRRRWARAEEILRNQRVVLRSWREGTEVMDEAVRIVEKAMRSMGTEGARTHSHKHNGHSRD